MPSSFVVPGAVQAVGTVEAGVAVAVVTLGTIAGLFIARALIERRPTRSCLRTFVLLVVLAVAARTVLSVVDALASIHSLATFLDAAMIALTVSTLWVARARQTELGAERKHTSR